MPLETSFIADERILVDVAATLTSTRLTYTGEPAAAVGAVTVSVVRSDDTALLTDAATTAVGAGVYSAALTVAQNDRLDVLTATWVEASGSTWQTVHEVVGGVWFTVAEARSRDDKLADAVKYPIERILAVRAEVEHLLEVETGQAWVPRFARIRRPGTGNRWMPTNLPRLRAVRAVTEQMSPGGTANTWTSADRNHLVAQSSSGVLERMDGFSWDPRLTYVFDVEHGYDSPPPDLRDAAITLLRHRLNSHRSGIPDRATSMSTEAGQTYALATPGLRGFITGIPEVDVAISRHRFMHYGIA